MSDNIEIIAERRRKQRERSRRWYANHHEEAKQRARKRNNDPARRRYLEQWNARNLEKKRAANLRFKHKTKMQALAILGSRCVGYENDGCPWRCEDPRLLTFDHIFGDGYLIKGTRRGELSRLLKKGAVRERLQILCLYCHALKTLARQEYRAGRSVSRDDNMPLLELLG